MGKLLPVTCSARGPLYSMHRQSNCSARLHRAKLAPRCGHNSTSVQTKQAVKEIIVPAGELRSNIRLSLVNEGRGQAVQLDAVIEGSLAWQLGLRPGQLLRGLEDPIRSDQMYELGDRPSLRFVTDAIMMTMHSQVKIEVEDAVLAAPAAAAATVAVPKAAPKAAAAAASDDGTADRSRSVISALDALTGATAGPTIAEQLEQQLAAMQAEGTAPEREGGEVWLSLAVEEEDEAAGDSSVLNSLVAAQTFGTEGVEPANELQARVLRRKEYMDQVAQRSDAPVFSGLFAAFVVPPAVILGVAYATGYMDTLYSNTLSHLH